MAKEKKEPSPAATNTSLGPKNLVPEITRAVAASLGRPVVELAQDLGVSIEDTIRFLAVTRECVRSRELARLSVRDVAYRLRTPEYRIHDIESGHIRESSPRCFGNTSACLGWYAEWSRVNSELAKRHVGAPWNPTGRLERQRTSPDCVAFQSEVVAVKARIRLVRSFDQISHQYQGYTLCLSSSDPESCEVLRIAIGPAAHKNISSRLGTSSLAEPNLC